MNGPRPELRELFNVLFKITFDCISAELECEAGVTSTSGGGVGSGGCGGTLEVNDTAGRAGRPRSLAPPRLSAAKGRGREKRRAVNRVSFEDSFEKQFEYSARF